jgi:hypothetical protein
MDWELTEQALKICWINSVVYGLNKIKKIKKIFDFLKN